MSVYIGMGACWRAGADFSGGLKWLIVHITCPANPPARQPAGQVSKKMKTEKLVLTPQKASFLLSGLSGLPARQAPSIVQCNMK